MKIKFDRAYVIRRDGFGVTFDAYVDDQRVRCSISIARGQGPRQLPLVTRRDRQLLRATWLHCAKPHAALGEVSASADIRTPAIVTSALFESPVLSMSNNDSTHGRQYGRDHDDCGEQSHLLEGGQCFQEVHGIP